MTTPQEESLELLKEYASAEYTKINQACYESTRKITKGMFELSEKSESDQNPDELLSQI